MRARGSAFATPVRMATPPRNTPSLPRIDEHEVQIEATPERVWKALLDSFADSRRAAGIAAALLGCRERKRAGDLGEVGSTIVGFRVASSQEPNKLTLEGKHRFSSYVLAFSIADLGPARSELRARTDAAFPRALGYLYRPLVIGSGLHVRAVQRTLDAVKRRAERAG
jgi:hypothetical protein